MIESSIVLDSGKIIDYNIGTLGTVEFNFFRIWDYWKKSGKSLIDLIFIHVHPSGVDSLSLLDLNCMKGFLQAFSKPIIFYIVLFKDENLFSTDCKIKGYIMHFDENIEEIEFWYNPVLDYNVLLFLKYLSYGNLK